MTQIGHRIYFLRRTADQNLSAFFNQSAFPAQPNRFRGADAAPTNFH